MVKNQLTRKKILIPLILTPSKELSTHVTKNLNELSQF